MISTCSTSGFAGSLTLEPSQDGKTWSTALLAVAGGSGTHNNATIYVRADTMSGTSVVSTTTTKIATSDDFVANAAPREIGNWTPAPRVVQPASGNEQVVYSYWADIVFDKANASDPSCTTPALLSNYREE